MAEDGPALNPFPDPPPFFKYFTTENLKRLQDIENGASNGAETSHNTAGSGSKLSTEQILTLPAELRYLIPPPPPADDESFHVFGETTKSSGTNNFTQMMSFIAARLGPPAYTLNDWSYTQLYPSSTSDSTTAHSTHANIDRQQYLNRFNRSIIIEFIRLLGIISLDPTSPHKDAVLKHILTLVCNMHALINEYRPHQARETLIGIMEEQVQRKKREIEGVKGMRDKVQGVLDGFAKAIEGESERGGEVRDDKREAKSGDPRREKQRGMWDALDEVLGH